MLKPVLKGVEYEENANVLGMFSATKFYYSASHIRKYVAVSNFRMRNR